MKKNGFPLSTIKQLTKEIEDSQKQEEFAQVSMTEQANSQEWKVHFLLLPFAGSKGTNIIKNLNKTLKNVLPSNVKRRITYTGQKFNIRFKIEDKINEKHIHDLIYFIKCPEAFCMEDYLGETGCRIIERVTDHAGKDKQSHLFKHASTRNHRHVDLGNIKIIDFSFHNNKLKWKISEALYIKQYQSSLISQEQSVELKLFN